MLPKAMLTAGRLRERGWTGGMIEALLGQPDALARNPCCHSGSPMRLYTLARIEAAERAPGFAVALALAEQRSAAARKAATTRREALLRQVEAMPVEVAVLPADELRRRAIRVFNLRCGEGMPEDEGSDPAFLARITVNFIRHCLSRYDYALPEVAGRVGVGDAVMAIRRKVYAAIADAYPDLAAKCERQKLARGLA